MLVNLFWFLSSCMFLVVVRNEENNKVSLATKFLKTYGYVTDDRDLTRRDIQTALRSFQRHAHMRPTGKLTKKTIRLMRKPRCGLPDVDRSKRHKRSLIGWQQSVVTWSVTKLSGKLTKFQLIRTLQKALKTWSKEIPLMFRYVTKDPDIDIQFVRGEHGDGFYNAFDGKGKVLAHAFRPGSTKSSGDTHFDEDEPWSIDTESGRNLLAVAVHEFGHAIGLEHSFGKNDVMSPYLDKLQFKLQQNDKFRAQQIYGQKKKRKPLKYLWYMKRMMHFKNVIQPTYLNKSLKICNQIDDIFKDSNMEKNADFARISKSDGKNGAHIASMRYSIPLKQNDKENPGLIKAHLLSKRCHGVPSNIDAIEYIDREKKFYIFKGEKFWKCDEQIPADVTQKNITSHKRYEYPRAAVLIPRWGSKKRLYLFGDNYFWEWNFWKDDVIRNSQVKINRYWKGVPNAPDAVTYWFDGYLYFLKNYQYVKVDPRTRRSLKGYPKSLPVSWLKDIC